jgi:hypothetical protein
MNDLVARCGRECDQQISKSRSQKAKQAFYSDLCRELKENCDINPSDLVVSVVTNSASGWSFGNGRAQFNTDFSSLSPQPRDGCVPHRFGRALS